MWKKLTTSKEDVMVSKMKEALATDNGLVDFTPSIENSGNFVTEERLLKIFPILTQYMDHYIQYPDKFIELISPPETQFKLYPFQVLTLRMALRYQKLGLTATRGFSKSFIALLAKELKCIFFPGIKESLVATTKRQATEIGRAKMDEIGDLLPLIKNERDSSHGSGSTKGDDYITQNYKNKSSLDIVSVGDSQRGGRRHSMLFEESAKMEAKPINEVVLPLLNIARRNGLGILNPDENHQQQVYVTSAGSRHSFGYDKMMEILINSVFEPDRSFCGGFDYRIPMRYGLINKDFINDFKHSSTYDEDSFAREYGSKWTSSVEGSLFDYDKLTGLRTIKRAEWKPRVEDDTYYVASVDVARSQARTVIEIFKVRIGSQHFTKSVVNIFLMEGRNFLHQASKIKELDGIFGFEWIAIDTNGLGVGLVDFLMNETAHSETGEIYPAYNVKNIKEYPIYQIDQKPNAPAKIWVVKTNQSNAGEIHKNAYNQLFGGKVKLLIDEKKAKTTLMEMQKGRKMTYEERIRYMVPYQNTSLLVAETSNLKLNNATVNMKLELIRTDAEKDTFSALEYGLHCICVEEKEYYAKRRRNKSSLGDAMLIN